MTLIEVVAGLALLAGVTTTLLYANVRFKRQATVLHERAGAIDAADQLLAQWWLTPEDFPINRTGTVRQLPKLRWRTIALADPEAQTLGGTRVRFEMLRGDIVQVGVDLVVPPKDADR